MILGHFLFELTNFILLSSNVLRVLRIAFLELIVLFSFLNILHTRVSSIQTKLTPDSDVRGLRFGSPLFAAQLESASQRL